MQQIGYLQIQVDHTLFIKHQHNGMTALIVYVDDIVVTEYDFGEVENLKTYLSQQFERKDLRPLQFFLGIEALHTKKMNVSISKYVLDILDDASMLGCRPCDTPDDPNCKLREDDGKRLTNVRRYQRLVGKLIYFSLIRPNISYAVGHVSQFMHVHTTIHIKATEILKVPKKESSHRVVLWEE